MNPTNEDPVAVAASGLIGGPFGRFARRGTHWWSPLRVLVAFTAVAYGLGFVLDLSCRKTGWISPERYEHLCYSDIPPLYSLRGFADGLFPYLQTMPGQNPLEYPVLTGVFMQLAALLTRAATGIFSELDAARTFFDINVILLLIPLIIAVVATAMTVKRRPWDAAMVALAPTVILAATVNWDLLPLAFAGVSLVLWSRSRPMAAGILLGLAIAAKFYPLFFLGAFLVLTIRTGRWRAFGSLVLGTAIAWLAVNLPFMVANVDGWSYFYRFSQERGQDFGSIWFALSQFGLPSVPAESLNVIASGLFLLLCVAIGVLALSSERRPRLAQLLFLIVAAFAVTNKVYSPQYVLWLVPLAALARPKWRDFLIWQAGELIYFAAVWWFLVGYGATDTKGLTPQWYGVATLVHIGVTIWFAALIIRDVLRPQNDPVRNDGFDEDSDDPGGGVFDRAPDALTTRGHLSR
ncbi:unannotated protein [freshwater metagenome]|uniref:Unannotated protein n=1 Tax=freshwater metagenome TaxID=449393 RepID=A0A6J7EPU1_9ZZZZ